MTFFSFAVNAPQELIKTSTEKFVFFNKEIFGVFLTYI